MSASSRFLPRLPIAFRANPTFQRGGLRLECPRCHFVIPKRPAILPRSLEPTYTFPAPLPANGRSARKSEKCVRASTYVRLLG
jgi:hypothetical protein